ncbi:hypothetical protein BDQ17DRAFT_1370508 [Cyathus striatus]|nr:hypothetical protein BDQ17DRAFT_1370508 [Cyathus striatus]
MDTSTVSRRQIPPSVENVPQAPLKRWSTSYYDALPTQTGVAGFWHNACSATAMSLYAKSSRIQQTFPRSLNTSMPRDAYIKHWASFHSGAPHRRKFSRSGSMKGIWIWIWILSVLAFFDSYMHCRAPPTTRSSALAYSHITQHSRCAFTPVLPPFTSSW